MNHFEVIEHVVTHLAQQKVRATENGNRDCLYRVFDEDHNATAKCAAGCMIPDSLYDPSMEGQNLELVMANFQDVREYFRDLCPNSHLDETKNLLKRLQNIHDSTPVEDWPKAFYYFAMGTHSLTFASKVIQIFRSHGWENTTIVG